MTDLELRILIERNLREIIKMVEKIQEMIREYEIRKLEYPEDTNRSMKDYRPLQDGFRPDRN